MSSCRCSCGVRLTASRLFSIFLIHEPLQRKVEKGQDEPDISDLGFHNWARCQSQNVRHSLRASALLSGMVEISHNPITRVVLDTVMS